MCSRIVGQHALVFSWHNDELRNQSFAVIQSQTFVFLLAEDHLLAVLEYDATLCASLAVGNPVVGAIVEDYTVHKALNHARAFVLVRLYHAVDGGRHVHIQRAGKEGAACTEYQFCRDEWTLYSTKWTGLTYKALRRSRRVLTFGESVYAVVEEADIQIHISANLVDKVVTTDSKAVAIARHLPYTQFGVTGLNACSDSATATVNSIETVGVQIVRHTARTADTRYYYSLVSWYTHLCHRFLKRHTDSMVATSWTELYILIALKLTCFHTSIL